jgi:prepilin-type N-terminal cleavage/methylation domain-containing protein
VLAVYAQNSYASTMNRRGFTIIELVIVVAILGVLLVLGVVNLRGTQANGRDKERATDIDTIAANLEIFYKSGTDGSTTVGRYASTAIIGSEKVSLRDLDLDALSTPSASASSFVAATNALQTTATVTPQPTSTNDIYVYQPLQSNGTLCVNETQDCRKFNLYYWTESTNTVATITSKNQ